ncbi:MAG: hypothetical protein NTU64_08840 [Hyphomicrobiales bacterium]|nr:hypothetical protein [Hyphomicrobiales bacterium]
MIALRPTRPTAQAIPARAFSGVAMNLHSVMRLTLAVAVFAAPVAARAADDDTPLDTKIIRNILEGIGLQRENRSINYQERAPLVIPPSKTLPPPERSDAMIANNPAWPKDPDVERAKAEAARERTTVIWAGDEARKQDSALRGSDLGPGPSKRSASRAGKSESNWSSDDPRLKPSELGYKGGLFSSIFGGNETETAKFTGEPPRATLTEPPPGYRTPSPAQPYGVGAGENAPKAIDYATKHGEGTK